MSKLAQAFIAIRGNQPQDNALRYLAGRLIAGDYGHKV